MRLTSWLARPGLLLAFVARLRLATRLVREPRVPAVVKLLPLAVALYVVFPFDLVPDLLPVLGQLDDLAAVVSGLELFFRLCPASAAAFHRAAIARGEPYAPMTPEDDYIDASWRRE